MVLHAIGEGPSRRRASAAPVPKGGGCQLGNEGPEGLPSRLASMRGRPWPVDERARWRASLDSVRIRVAVQPEICIEGNAANGIHVTKARKVRVRMLSGRGFHAR